MPDTNPSVFITPNALTSNTNKKRPNISFVIGFVLIVIVVVLGVGIWRSTSNKSSSSSTANRTPVDTKPKIVLVSDKKQYKVGDGVILAVGVSTAGKKTDGTDVVLHYDNKLLSASTSGLLNGNIYPDYPIANVDQSTGTIRVSGISSVSKTFAGQGLLTTVLMTTLKPGQANILVDYTPGSTTDSNIVEAASSKDILEEVNNLTLDIK